LKFVKTQELSVTQFRDALGPQEASALCDKTSAKVYTPRLSGRFFDLTTYGLVNKPGNTF